MAKMTTKIALYPGCSLEGSGGAFQTSLAAVFRALGIEVADLEDWSCCGASSAHAVDHKLHLALTMRNLALVEAQGYKQVVAPCAACYHRLAGAEAELGRDPELRKSLNAQADLDYKGETEVRNVLALLTQDVGLGAIAARVKRRLSGLRVACYYGCLNTRIPRTESFDDREYPMSMDSIVDALGAEALDWSYKTECCGASLFVTDEGISAKLVSKILKDASARGADCIVVACPMCHNNIDTKQDAIREQFNVDRPMPVLFITQLMGLALGCSESELDLGHSFVPFELAKS